MRLACWLAAGWGLCEREFTCLLKGKQSEGELGQEFSFYCLAARTTTWTSRLRSPFILEVVMYDHMRA